MAATHGTVDRQITCCVDTTWAKKRELINFTQKDLTDLYTVQNSISGVPQPMSRAIISVIQAI